MRNYHGMKRCRFCYYTCYVYMAESGLSEMGPMYHCDLFSSGGLLPEAAVDVEVGKRRWTTINCAELAKTLDAQLQPITVTFGIPERYLRNA